MASWAYVDSSPWLFADDRSCQDGASPAKQHEEDDGPDENEHKYGLGRHIYSIVTKGPRGRERGFMTGQHLRELLETAKVGGEFAKRTFLEG